MSIFQESLALLNTTGASAHHRQDMEIKVQSKGSSSDGTVSVGAVLDVHLQKVDSSCLREDVVEHPGNDDGAPCMHRQPRYRDGVCRHRYTFNRCAGDGVSCNFPKRPRHSQCCFLIGDIFIQTDG